jgi:hypothetical protein
MATGQFTVGDQVIRYDTDAGTYTSNGAPIAGTPGTRASSGQQYVGNQPVDANGNHVSPFVGQVVDGHITYVPNPAYPGTLPGYTPGNGNQPPAGTQYGGTPTIATAQGSGSDAANIRNLLRTYDLDELGSFVDEWVRQGLTWPEIEAMLYDPGSAAGAVVDRKYPELRLRREAGHAPMSIGQIRAYRDTATQIFRAAGLPQGFYDTPQDFTRFIVNDVSAEELQTRVQDGFVRVMAAPPEVRDQLQNLYGLGTGDLAAFFLDETKALPLIQRRVAAAEISGAGVRAGFGGLSVNEAERVASLGVSGEQAGQQLSTLANARELFTPLDRGEDVISRDEQLGAVFDNNAAAQRRIQDRARRRQAAFSGGGGLATSREGLAGLSTSS